MRDDNHERESKVIELRITNESLRKENFAKDREIRRLNKDIQQCELTLANLRSEVSQGKCHGPEVIKKDAEVMAGMCCTGTECGDLEPVKDVGELLREETSKYRERIHKMELSLKSSGVKVRAVHKINLGLIEELSTLRRLCVAVDLERRDARLRLDLEGQIVKQMLKQLQQAKAKLQQKELETSRSDFVSGDHDYRQPSLTSMPVACAKQPRARRRHAPPAPDQLDSSADFRSPGDLGEGNGDGKSCQVATSTPDGSLEVLGHDSDISIIPPQTECPVMVSDSSLDGPEVLLEKCTSHQQLCSQACDIHEQPTITLETPDESQTSNHQSQTTQTKRKNLVTFRQFAKNNLGTLEANDRSDNKSDSSKQIADKSETSKRKRNKSTISENQSMLDENKTPMDTTDNKSLTSQDESCLSSNIDVSSNFRNANKLLKKCVQIQIPNRVHESDYCDLSDEDIHESTKDCVRVQKREEASKSFNVEKLSIDKDVNLKLKPCPCTNLDCIHKDEAGNQLIDETTDATASDKKDSGGGSSCAGACEQYYRNKLMATLQILENKEETIRVQGSSLGVAEARIAALTERACALRCELDHKARELNKLRKFAESCRVERSDVSITAEMQEVETQKQIVNTLQDNLSVIAELYRECFFETAKQEELIEMLRKSYLDVRLMDKDKSDKINRLQNVINTQKWSIEQCQDVVMEVENLKSEISNFLNSSNNDSGMWERGSESPDVGEELGDILDQLRQLQDMLAGDCTCGLEDENMALKQKNENLEMQVDKLRQRVNELESTVSSSHSIGQQYQQQIEEKEREFHEVRRKLIEFESANKEREITCETLARQLQQAQVLLDDKSAELAEAQRARATQEVAVHALRVELDQADAVIKEGLRKLVESSQWRAQLDESQAKVAELELQLQTVCAQCRTLEICCREKERSARALQHQLEEAHARGAALCDESRRVTGCVRQWMRRQRALAREQQEKIRMQEAMLCELQRCVEARQNHSVRTSPSETEPCCSKSLPRLHSCPSETTSYPRCSRTHHAASGSETAFSRCGLPLPHSMDRENEMASCSKCASNRQDRRERSSESEMASCASIPVPPRRRKKLPPCGDIRCPWAGGAPRPRAAPSPTEQVVERVEQLHAALAAGQRRWARTRR